MVIKISEQKKTKQVRQIKKAENINLKSQDTLRIVLYGLQHTGKTTGAFTLGLLDKNKEATIFLWNTDSSVNVKSGFFIDAKIKDRIVSVMDDKENVLPLISVAEVMSLQKTMFKYADENPTKKFIAIVDSHDKLDEMFIDDYIEKNKIKNFDMYDYGRARKIMWRDFFGQIIRRQNIDLVVTCGESAVYEKDNKGKDQMYGKKVTNANVPIIKDKYLADFNIIANTYFVNRFNQMKDVKPKPVSLITKCKIDDKKGQWWKPIIVDGLEYNYISKFLEEINKRITVE